MTGDFGDFLGFMLGALAVSIPIIVFVRKTRKS